MTPEDAPERPEFFCPKCDGADVPSHGPRCRHQQRFNAPAPKGLYGKYRVERTDGRDVGPCFVLELTDPKAHDALLTYAETVEAHGNARLAADLRKWVLAYQRIEEVLGG